MKTPARIVLLSLGAVLVCTGASHARQDLITNGGFESGFAAWTRADQLGSDGSFFDQSGALSPINGLAVQAPPEGAFAAMTDAAGPGSHVLYQDFVVPAGVTLATLRFSLFINNTAAAFSTPLSLDFSTAALCQQARVDIMSSAADPFSTVPADILQNLFTTAVGSPLVSGYNTLEFDITTLLTTHAGQTLRLRFAEADNVNIFNFGVDAVSLAIPAPSAFGLLAMSALACGRRPRR